MALFKSQEEKDKEKQQENLKKANNPQEVKLLNKIVYTWQKNAEGDRTNLEEIWNNEYKMYVGKQWDTTLAPRTVKAKKIRPNSQDNFIFPAIYNMRASLTATQPESIVEGTDDQDKDLEQIADKLTDVISDVRYKNRFPKLWKRGVLEWLKHGMFIMMVSWDNDWIGGSGPNRWIGEVRHTLIDKSEFFPDPAIRNLEQRLQECSFINLRLRKKLDYIQDRWADKGIYVQNDNDNAQDEGSDPEQAWVYMSFHKGKPQYVPSEWKQAFEEKAQEAESQGLPYKAKDYRDKANGTLKGVHLAYCTKDVVLEYVPYIYDDGEYPFAFGILYEDEENPLGLGEVRNVMMPQIAHNKADEIELEAMAKEGLGGAYYTKGGIDQKQKVNIEQNSGKGGVFLEVNDINSIKERTGVKVPASISIYKEHKQRMIETITQNTPIMQGMKPGGVQAYSAIAELGARADTKNKDKIELLEDFLRDITHLEISRIAQFYTYERTYAVRRDKTPIMSQDQTGQTVMQMPAKSGTFSANEMMRTWVRNDGVEEYIPEFNVKVKIMDEKPTDRNYYINTAINLASGGFIDIESLWYTIDEGKFPPREEVLARLMQQKQASQQGQEQFRTNIAVAFADLPAEGKAELAQQMGLNLDPSMFVNDMVLKNQLEAQKTNMQAQAQMQVQQQTQQQNQDQQLNEQLMKILAGTNMNSDEINSFIGTFKSMPQQEQMRFLNMKPEQQMMAVNSILGNQ